MEVTGKMEVTSGTEMSGLTMLKEGVRIALGSISANKVRSGLTILGVAIGVGVVVMISALITGIRTSVMEGFESAGPDNFGVMRFDFSAVRASIASGREPWWNKPAIEPEEAERIARLPAVQDALYNFSFHRVAAQLVHCLLFREDAPPPSFVVDITDHLETKMAALACFESQFSGKTSAGEVFGGGDRPLEDQIRTQCAHHGSRIRCAYGEPFWTRETVALESLGSDLVSTF